MSVLVLLIVLFAIGVWLYNRLAALQVRADGAWADVDVQLKRRYDLVPNLVETVRGYAAHEREVFEEVTRARAAATAATGSPAEQAAAEGPLVAALRQLFAVAENYPQLRANENFLQLQAELANTEDRLQTARRFYNANVRDYNRRVGSFPSNLVAAAFGFREEEFFEIEEAIREAGPPRVSFPPAGAAEGGAPAGPPAGPAPGSPAGPAPTGPAPQEPPSAPPQAPAGGAAHRGR